MGAEILKPEPHSLLISANVKSWESWNDLTFPETGDYCVPPRPHDGANRQRD